MHSELFHNTLYQAKFEYHASERRNLISSKFSESAEALLSRDVQDRLTHTIRAERDFWLLLTAMEKYALLKDIDDTRCEARLEEIMDQVDVRMTDFDVINLAYSKDDRIKKGFVIQKWLEKCAEDRVTQIPKPTNNPWATTLSGIIESRGRPRQSQIKSIHPDAQLSQNGCVFKLDGSDQVDQENLLRLIWSYIRCGQHLQAQLVAANHDAHWLASALQGIAQSSYELEQRDINAMEADMADHEVHCREVRKGNLRKAVWLRTSWKYAEKLASNAQNWSMNSGDGGNIHGECLSGILDMTIFSALSNNTKVLTRSPVISSWSDSIWLQIKAAHETDKLRIVLRLHEKQAGHSKLMPGSHQEIISAEKELLALAISSELAVGSGIRNGSCDLQLRAAPVPATARPNWRAEELLLQLQAALISGQSALHNYIDTVMVSVCKAATFPYAEVVLRDYSHLLLWLRSPPSADNTNRSLGSLVTDKTLHIVLECFIHILIDSNQCQLVALYAAELCLTRRIAVYCTLFRKLTDRLHSSRMPAEESDIVLQEIVRQAAMLFGDDVLHVLRVYADLMTHVDGALGQVLPTVGIYGPISSDVPYSSSQWPQRIHSFHWLFVLRQFKPEAREQCSMLMNQLYLLGHIEQMQLLIAEHKTHLISFDEEPIRPLAQNVLLFWSNFITIRQMLLDWRETTSKFYSKQNRVSGSLQIMKSTMAASVELVQASALRVFAAMGGLINGAAMDQVSFADGIGQLFSSLEMDAFTKLDAAVAQTKANSLHVSAYGQLPFTAALFAGCEEAVSSIESLSSQLFAHDIKQQSAISQIISILRAANLPHAVPLHRDAHVNRDSSVDATPDTLTKVELSLRQVVVALESIDVVRKTARSVVFELIKQQMEVCSVTADILKSVADDDRAKQWFIRGVHLANVVASENPALRLYSIMHRADIAELLAGINKFALGITALDSRLSV